MGVHDAVAATRQLDKGVEILHASEGEAAAHVGGGGHSGDQLDSRRLLRKDTIYNASADAIECTGIDSIFLRDNVRIRSAFRDDESS